MSAALARHWLALLVVLLGFLYALLGADERGISAILGVAGGLAIVALAATAGRLLRRASVALLVLAAVPFAAVTWWSIVTPSIALLVLVLGGVLLLGGPRGALAERAV